MPFLPLLLFFCLNGGTAAARSQSSPPFLVQQHRLQSTGDLPYLAVQERERMSKGGGKNTNSSSSNGWNGRNWEVRLGEKKKG